MYILNNQEKAYLITIAKRTRIDYLTKNNYIYIEDSIDMLDEDIFVSDENIENDFARKCDLCISAEEFEKIFTDLNLLKSTKRLSFREKLVLFSYYSEQKTDARIGKELHLKTDTVRKIRDRATEKIYKTYFKMIGGNKDDI